MTASPITIRLSEDKDMPAILNLWEKYSGWGAITEQQYVDWFINLPYGKCLIVVAEDEAGEVAGQAIFSPAPFFFQGRIYKALRIAAPIFKDDIREATIYSSNHLAVQMLLYAMDVGKEQGYTLLYSFPARGWLVLFRRLPRISRPNVITEAIDCFSISLTSPTTPYAGSLPPYTVTTVADFDPSFDVLWQEAVESFPIQCGLVRDSKWLNWKLKDHLVLAMRTDGLLVGYVALNRQSGLLVDCLARTPDTLRTVLACAVWSVHAVNSDRIPVPFTEIKGMYTPVLKTVLDGIEHTMVDFQFAFTGYLLDPSLGLDNVSADHWYMMPND
jgi:hypothetical protein